MAELEVARLTTTVAEQVTALATADDLDPDVFRVWARRKLPQDPPSQYAVLDWVPAGTPWDPSLRGGATSGWVAYQATAVGPHGDAALWVLDRLRALTKRITPTDLVFAGTTRAIARPQSTGAPASPTQGDGATWFAAETYRLPVEAQ